MNPPMGAAIPVILFLVQFLLAITWTLYVAFLPQLAAQTGIAKEHVGWILLMDQAIFISVDCAVGIAADRVADTMRRLGTGILCMTVLSCAAFVVLPQTTSAAVLVTLTALWAATSSALRAPPMVLIARRLNTRVPSFLVSCSILGIGVASALAPILTARLRGVSPTLPFVAASVGLLAAVAAMRLAEKQTGSTPQESGATRKDTAPVARAYIGLRMLWMFFAAACMLALGFQLHTALNSAPAYLRFVSPSDLGHFMPVFWIGFAVCALLPEAAFVRRVPPHVLLLAATAVGALALSGFATADSIETVVVTQFIAGGAWGAAFCTAANGAVNAGRVGLEGFFTGLLFALFAVAAFARIALAASGAMRHPGLAGVLPWLPTLAWACAALLLGVFVANNHASFSDHVSGAGQRRRHL